MTTQSIAVSDLAATKKKITGLLAMEQITKPDIEDFSTFERKQLNKVVNKTLARLKGTEKDDFLQKIDPILPADAKNVVWENNHTSISKAISSYIEEYGVMPNKSDVAEQTGLSRQTVAKHFREYQSHPEYAAAMEQFKFMSRNVLASVFRYASNGDIKAARLYFEMIGSFNKQRSSTVVNEQTNYIQINNTILSQATLEQLSAEQLAQIENIVTNRAHKIAR